MDRDDKQEPQAILSTTCRCTQFLRFCMVTPGLWSLDDKGDPETQEVLQRADARPEDFVLKPQREGGGNNLYGAALQQRIADPQGLAAYILMQRIRPPINRFPQPQRPLLKSSTIASLKRLLSTCRRVPERP